MVSRMEIRKDTAQVVLESTAAHVGRIASILSGAVREVTHEFGEWATDIFEIREAADRAHRAHGHDVHDQLHDDVVTAD